VKRAVAKPDQMSHVASRHACHCVSVMCIAESLTCLPCVFHITIRNGLHALFSPPLSVYSAAEQVGTFCRAEGGREVLRGGDAGARRHHTLRILPKDLQSLPLLRRKVHGVP